jgi:polyisoprenoid-binding protein YceI
MTSIRRHWLRWAIGAVAVVAVLAVGGPFVYIHFIEGPAPAPFSLKPGSGGSKSSPGTPATGNPTADAGAAGPSVAGQWRVDTGSQVGYRVKEVLLGQDNLAVGRSSSVTGHLTITGTTVTAASFSVPMASIHSDESERDVQFDGRIMDVAAYPTGTFTLTRPIRLGPLPGVGMIKTYSATGNLTLHGHTRSVKFSVSAERAGSLIKISGSIPVLFADYDIGNPSFGSFVTTQNHGVLEFLLNFAKT